MDKSKLQRSDTTRGAPLRILSLDGGGVRGYSMLILLHDFMHKAYTECHDGVPPEPEKLPRPCDYFDLIAGTGTGGLIALMLGRLRMSTRDCMRVYVQMTRKVFETDKTIAGIPYRSTLFKASLLEDAIRACVREYEHERDTGDDETEFDQLHDGLYRDSNGSNNAEQRSPRRSDSSYRPHNSAIEPQGVSRPSTSSSSHFSALRPDAYFSNGNADATLVDPRRERRTKTAVTAVLKGQTERSGTSVLLRSYPSRTQPAIEAGCAVWQAGRATCATKLAFKEIRIGTSTFLDEGFGLLNIDGSPTYNPGPQILEEAVVNEWPGQSVGLFLSIGTGKRPPNTQHMQTEWWEGFASGLSSFAEARRNLIAKIEGCERTHQEMMSTHLPKRGVNSENYLRLNVEVGVGEFGMNEWHRLAEISNNTQAYLNAPQVKSMLRNGATQMARVEAHRVRAAHADRQALNHRSHPAQEPHRTSPSPTIERALPYRSHPHPAPSSTCYTPSSNDAHHMPSSAPLAVELPASMPAQPSLASFKGGNSTGDSVHSPKLRVSSHPSDINSGLDSHHNGGSQNATNISSHRNPQASAHPSHASRPTHTSSQTYPLPATNTNPPIIPPKTPLPASDATMPTAQSRGRVGSAGSAPNAPNHAIPSNLRPSKLTPHNRLPYPDTEGPPPIVNLARKPYRVYQ